MTLILIELALRSFFQMKSVAKQVVFFKLFLWAIPIESDHVGPWPFLWKILSNSLKSSTICYGRTGLRTGAVHGCCLEKNMMKTINVTINARFDVPDDWEVVEHVPDQTFPDDKLTVLKINDAYYDFFPECLMKVNDGEKIFWSTDEGQTETIIDCMQAFKVNIIQDDNSNTVPAK